MLSIVIIVKDDRDVSNTLIQLQELPSEHEYEIIVVDGSNGRLSDIKKMNRNVIWIDFKNITHKKITIPEQRNEGVLAAKGNIIIFIDAGCIPADRWLDNIVAPILNEDEDIVAGKTLSLGSITTRDQTASLNQNKSYLDEAPTINLAIAKKVFDTVGLFDTTFPIGEDIDFTWRAIEYGYKIRYSEIAIVKHNWGTFKQEIARSFNYGKARARLYKKHYKRWKKLFSTDITAVIYPLYIICLPLTIYIWFYPFLLVIPFFKNRKHRPISVLIDHLVYGLGVINGAIFTI